MVRGGKQIDTRTIRQLAEPLVPPADLGEFVAMVFSDLHHLQCQGGIASGDEAGCCEYFGRHQGWPRPPYRSLVPVSATAIDCLVRAATAQQGHGNLIPPDLSGKKLSNFNNL